MNSDDEDDKVVLLNAERKRGRPRTRPRSGQPEGSVEFLNNHNNMTVRQCLRHAADWVDDEGEDCDNPIDIVMVVGFRKNGGLFTTCSRMTNAEYVYLCEAAKDEAMHSDD